MQLNPYQQGPHQPWFCWRSLNRLHIDIGRAKTTMSSWGFIDNTVNWECVATHTSSAAGYLMGQIPEDLISVTERAKACAQKWQCIVWRKREKKNRAIFMWRHLGWKRSLVTLKSTFVRKLWHLCHQSGHLGWNTKSSVNHYQEQTNRSECF